MYYKKCVFMTTKLGRYPMIITNNFIYMNDTTQWTQWLSAVFFSSSTDYHKQNNYKTKITGAGPADVQGHACRCPRGGEQTGGSRDTHIITDPSQISQSLHNISSYKHPLWQCHCGYLIVFLALLTSFV